MIDEELHAPQELIEATRALRPLIEAEAPRIEAARRITPEVVAALQNVGLYRMLVPKSLGGMELSLNAYSEVMQEVAAADASTAWCLSQNSGICRVSAYLPHNGALEVFGRPDAVLSWGNGPGTARVVEGGYVLTTRLQTSSGCHHATWLGCQDAELADEHGNVDPSTRGRRHGAILFFPASEARIEDVWQVSGLRGTGSDTYSVTELFVPERHRAAATPFEKNPLYLFSTTNIFAIGFASVCLGIARASLDALEELAGGKTSRGASSTMREQTRVQGVIGRNEAHLRSVRAYLQDAIAEAWQQVGRSRRLDMRTRIDLRLATTYTMQRCAAVVDAAYTTAGSTAVYTSNAFERRFRDMHAATQHIQARDDHFENVGKYVLGGEPDTGWL
ncbi:MAG TPA: acyl-CoA dehydrogenase family protein [Dehalococcoidia bacterium]|nr:acyl-CoA dehydrogenase family protein [Dehalococcoidia bacterium]